MAVLNPEIDKIEKGSAVEILYKSLLNGFNSAQEDTLPDYTSGEYVTEHIDENNVVTYEVNEQKINESIKTNKDISLKNSAYMFASGIGSLLGGGGSGGGSGGGGIFVSIGGDSMKGKLSANYGFTAGDQGVEFVRVYRTMEDIIADRHNIVEIDGELHLKDGIYFGGNKAIGFDNGKLSIDSPDIALNGKVTCADTITVGNVVITQEGIKINGGKFEYYHSGNANKADVDWTMKNGIVAGNLTVAGTSTLSGKLSALYGFSLGSDGKQVIGLDETGDKVIVGKSIDVNGSVFLGGECVLSKKTQTTISLSAKGKNLLLGDDGTKSINLYSDIYDKGGVYKLVGKEGGGYFPNSFRASHQFGSMLMETYSNGVNDAGVIFGKFIRFGTDDGSALSGDGDAMKFTAPFRYADNTSSGVVTRTEQKNTLLQYAESTSLYAPQNRRSTSLFFTTDSDFYVFDKPVEGKTSIGITNSKTRISDKQLFFDDAVYWQGIIDGVKHYGNAYMVNDIGSVKFSSGFSGSGWKIYKNKLTGNICATFDELTIRKKMRLYELEVQKISVTNGSLWVSDSCSGDVVEEIL